MRVYAQHKNTDDILFGFTTDGESLPEVGHTINHPSGIYKVETIDWYIPEEPHDQNATPHLRVVMA